MSWQVVTWSVFIAWWTLGASGKMRDQTWVQKDRRKTSRHLCRAGKSCLGSGPSHLTYSSKTSPSEPKLRLISKANVGTLPFSGPGLFYINPRVFLSSAKSAPLRSPLLSQQKGLFWSKRRGKAHTKSITHCVSLGYMCSAIATVTRKV